jgi:hypothetical protein
MESTDIPLGVGGGFKINTLNFFDLIWNVGPDGEPLLELLLAGEVFSEEDDLPAGLRQQETVLTESAAQAHRLQPHKQCCISPLSGNTIQLRHLFQYH